MEIIQYIIVGFTISLLGSIPVGLITLTIMARTVNRGKASGIMIGLGATIAEFVYPFIALKFLGFFRTESQIGDYIKLFSIFVFIGLGFYHFLKKGSAKLHEEEVLAKHLYQDFTKGVLLGFTNMLIIPFWIIVGIMLEGYDMPFVEDSLNFWFSLGAAFGAWMIFFLYVELVGVLLKRMEQLVGYTNKFVGVLFWGLAVFQVVNLFAALG